MSEYPVGFIASLSAGAIVEAARGGKRNAASHLSAKRRAKAARRGGGGADERQCQPCTACCDGWLRMEIGGVAVSPGHPCPHSTGSGCDDYANRPRSCVRFECGWHMAASPLPDWMRPDQSGVIVLFAKRRWMGRPVDVAVPVGQRIPPRALLWLKAFAEQHQRPLLYTEQSLSDGRYEASQQVFVHGPPAFREQVAAWQARGEPLW